MSDSYTRKQLNTSKKDFLDELKELCISYNVEIETAKFVLTVYDEELTTAVDSIYFEINPE